MLTSTLAAQSGTGKLLYQKRQYDLAAVAFLESIRTRKEQRYDRELLALSLIRTNRTEESLPYLRTAPFSEAYVRLFALLKAGHPDRAMELWSTITRSPFAPHEKELASLLGGSLYLERGDYPEARIHYRILNETTKSSTVKTASANLLQALDNYGSIPKKHPFLAGLFSALIPGTGQVYAHHTVDGITAFFFNAFFLGAAAYANRLETEAGRPHTGSTVLGSIGLVFYLANVTGAVQSARRYNFYYERKFQQEIRESFLNPDFIERSGSIRFVTPL